jgi:hypothetical protein
MSDQLLNYDTPLQRPSGMRTTAWISLLVLGILYVLGGFCVGISLAIIVTKLPAASRVVMIVVMGSMLLIAFGFGGALIWSAIRVRKGSRGAGIAALVMAILNALVILGFLCLGTIGIFTANSPRPEPAAWAGIIFYMLTLLGN